MSEVKLNFEMLKEYQSPEDAYKISIIVVINEQHRLFPDQIRAVCEFATERHADSVKLLKVPARGWTLDEMREVASRLATPDYDACLASDAWLASDFFVFASPIPALIKFIVTKYFYAAYYTDHVFVFHNDVRVKKTLPNGRIIMKVAPEGWQIV